MRRVLGYVKLRAFGSCSKFGYNSCANEMARLIARAETSWFHRYEKNDYRISLASKVNPICWAIINSQLRDANCQQASSRPNCRGQAVGAVKEFGLLPELSQSIQPAGEYLSFPYLYHQPSVAVLRLQTVNGATLKPNV